jgi:hypothetical protein
VGLKEKLQEDMKSALKSSDKMRLKVIRFILSQIKNAEIDKGGELNEDEIMKVISKEIKKIEEAAEEFKNGGNAVRAEEELKEAEILREYLPEPLTDEELEKIIEDAIAEVGAKNVKDMGAVMKVVMPKIAGRADGKTASELVKKKLG